MRPAAGTGSAVAAGTIAGTIAGTVVMARTGSAAVVTRTGVVAGIAGTGSAAVVARTVVIARAGSVAVMAGTGVIARTGVVAGIAGTGRVIRLGGGAFMPERVSGIFNRNIALISVLVPVADGIAAGTGAVAAGAGGAAASRSRGTGRAVPLSGCTGGLCGTGGATVLCFRTQRSHEGRPEQGRYE